MNKKVIAVAVVSIIVLLAVVLWFFNKDKKTEQELTLYGNVDIRQISLAFEQTGRIQSLSVQEGDKVKKGQ
ncbi:MAG: biotin/lipoyl-binding protein, partial [Pseudomonadota bacterium]|nr:biotin/lipoyl-binding protein [Pseudomonadota bacterium]